MMRMPTSQEENTRVCFIRTLSSSIFWVKDMKSIWTSLLICGPFRSLYNSCEFLIIIIVKNLEVLKLIITSRRAEAAARGACGTGLLS